AMIDGDLSLAEGVKAGDAEVDRMELELEADCMRLLALAQPVAGDLRLILAVIRISGQLERVADLARGVAKKLIKVSAMDTLALPPAMTDLAFATRTQLSDVLAALANEDAALCRQVRRSDQRVDDLYKEILIWGREEIPQHPETAQSAIDILTIAQRFERIADMTTNIAEDVIFMVEGRVVRHEAH
ncbi:MAG: phosphate signaling complex protein PhoU, partial [Phycisphaerales bacterium]